MNKKYILVGFVLFEILTVFFLLKVILNKKITKAVNINVINKKSITTNLNAKLQYYYEPKINNNGEEGGVLRATYSINTESLNEAKNYNVEKDSKVYRIITLGDSFTFGLGVDTRYNWTESLETLLNDEIKCINKESYIGFEVINLGVPGYDIQYSVERYKLRGKKYNPDLVLWLLKGDDFQEIKEIVQPKWNKFNSVNQKLYIPDSVLLAAPLQLAIEEITKELGEERILQLQESYIGDINKYYKKQLLIFTFNQTQKKYKNIMKKFTNERPLTYFYDDLVDIYNKEKDATFIPIDYHPNIKGHELIAKDIFTYLLKNGIIPCRNASSNKN